MFFLKIWASGESRENRRAHRNAKSQGSPPCRAGKTRDPCQNLGNFLQDFCFLCRNLRIFSFFVCWNDSKTWKHQGLRTLQQKGALKTIVMLCCQRSGKSLAVAVRSILANAEVDRAVGGCHHSQQTTGFTNDHDGQHCENLLEHADILSCNKLKRKSWSLGFLGSLSKGTMMCLISPNFFPYDLRLKEISKGYFGWHCLAKSCNNIGRISMKQKSN